MLAFGSAAGLSFSTTLASGKTASIGAGIGAALWFVWVQVSSFMAGAYLTGRLRKRKHDATAHEVEIRIVRQTFDLWVIGDAYIELVKILLAREKRSIVEIHRRALDRDY